jgi:hypothetical protein
MNWKGYGRKLSWPDFKVLYRDILMKTTKNLRQNSRSPGRELNSGPLEYEAGVLTTLSREVRCVHVRVGVSASARVSTHAHTDIFIYPLIICFSSGQDGVAKALQNCIRIPD